MPIASCCCYFFWGGVRCIDNCLTDRCFLKNVFQRELYGYVYSLSFITSASSHVIYVLQPDACQESDSRPHSRLMRFHHDRGLRKEFGPL